MNDMNDNNAVEEAIPLKTLKKPLTQAVWLLLAGCLSQPLWAAASGTTTADAAQIQALQAQTQQLQAQLAALQTQLVAMQKQQAKLIKQESVAASKPQAPAPSPAPTASAGLDDGTPPAAELAAAHALSQPPANARPLPTPRANPASPLTEGQGTGSAGKVTAYQQNVPEAIVADSMNTEGRVPYGQHMLANLGGFAVITSPYLHPDMAYSGGDLIVNYSSINKDSALLQQRQTFQHALYDLGYSMPRAGTLIELSGEIEGLAQAQTRNPNNYYSALDLTDAELDMQILANRWMTGFMSFSYNNFPSSSGNRQFNSAVQLNNGFITFGDLDVSKWRASVGQMYVPFGVYNSFMVTDPINKTLFRTLGRPLLIGYGVPGTPGFNAAAYTFVGTSSVGHINTTTAQGNNASWNRSLNQYGADANYQFNFTKNVRTTWGASYIANVADSTGMQSTNVKINSPNFQGFANNSGSEVLAHLVPGVDGRGELDVYDYSLIGEYTTATREFSPLNLTYNGDGAKPSAWHAEGVYSFSPWDKPSTVALSYDRSYQSLGLNVPQQSVGVAWNISIWRNTLLSLELRRSLNYSDDDTATGDLGPIFTQTEPYSDIASAEFQMFF